MFLKKKSAQFMEDKPLVNRVAQSGLIVINLEDFYPETDVVSFDLKEYLFKELILREKEFRQAMKEHDWSQYEGKTLCLFCSTDAIVPVWAYMLVATLAAPYAAKIFTGAPDEYLRRHYERVVEGLDVTKYEGERIILKGCSDKPVPPAAYVALSARLRPLVRTLMYGEPCSTVPIYKKPRPSKR